VLAALAYGEAFVTFSEKENAWGKGDEWAWN